MFSILLISIGVTFIILSVMVFSDKIKLLRTGIRVEGEVIDFEESTNSIVTQDKNILYTTIRNPIITFRNESGNMQRIVYDNSRNNKFYRIGDKVKLIYSRGDIKNIELNEIREMMVMTLKLLCIGVIFFVVGILFMSI